MKLRWKLAAGIACAGVVCAAIFLRPRNRAATDLDETRRALRQQGFKIDLAEFNLAAPAGLQDRADAILAVRMGRIPTTSGTYPDLMIPVGESSALVLWKAGWTDPLSGEDILPLLRDSLRSRQTELDDACKAALAGPIRFDLDATAGLYLRLPHLAALRGLSQVLAMRSLPDLQEGDTDAAWTNLLASTRLVTAWEVEPVEVSHLVQCYCVATDYDLTWQALQAQNWSDDRLAQLQREWESVDLFKGLADTAAFSRASTAAECQQERRTPVPASGVSLRQILQHPRTGWSDLTYHWRQVRYRNSGSYEDEKNLLLCYQDRELAFRHAAHCLTWAAMHQIPGITDPVPFRSKYYSRMEARWQQMQMTLAMQGGRLGLVGRVADAEARRRLIVAALALERYRGRHGSYPGTLTKLAPEFLKYPPLDFMDGKLLRYRLTADGHFLLYSIGLDCLDDGGRIPPAESGPSVFGAAHAPPGNIVWPLPASAAEAAAFRETKKHEREDRLQTSQRAAEEAANQREARRKAIVTELMTQIQNPAVRKVGSGASDPDYHGQPLSKLIRNNAVLGNTNRSLDELLTVEQIITGGEPDTATFELPISYDVVTNIGVLHLLVDAPIEKSDQESGDVGEFQECDRATNGDCLLVWNTTYDPPGQHVVRAWLYCNWPTLEVQGPPVSYYSSNLCQFDPNYENFGAKGATLYARLPESNGVYTINIKSPGGELVKTLKGTTSNGVILVEWNLIDDHGQRYTNASFDSEYNVTLPDSGRSGSMK